MSPLLSVCAGGVQADQRDAVGRPGLLEIHPVRQACELQVDVAASDRLDVGGAWCGSEPHRFSYLPALIPFVENIQTRSVSWKLFHLIELRREDIFE